ncbi:Putative HTH-type transcriptional regulator [Mycobacterium simulans]|uniref:HTH-type transcriptional regulator n=1 Tax=Mycobacterium simulans TaxID=627089 RepID=A0A7Z7IK66_9MYCO|nr:NB-ARC domain-containing protein [Mycobacterium simulans]SOJ55103.1 Putative HTH-type transcriptional regulator [Mycobacterium simulans]
MSYVIAVPELVEAAAQELASIRSALNEAAATAAGLHQQILTGDEANRRQQSRAESLVRAVVSPGLNFDRPRSGLLRRATSFVGHEQEVKRAVDALRAGPLVTLTGVGGVGKTRLAIEVARHEEERFSDGVAICELAPVEHGGAIGHTVATALRLRQQSHMDIEESVVEYLRARQVLLVVDNCEHLLDATAGLLERIVQHCPGVSVLATSRQPLGVEGSGLSFCRRCRWRMPRGCLPIARAPAGRTSTLTSSRRAWWLRFAGGLPACRWVWSWPQRGCG